MNDYGIAAGNRFSAIVGSGWDKDGLPTVVHISGTIGKAAHTTGAFWATLDSDSREWVGLSRCVVFVNDVTACWTPTREERI